MYDGRTQGLINMGTAETKLVDAEVCRLLEKITSETSLRIDLHYNKFEGTTASETIANYWQNVIFERTRTELRTTSRHARLYRALEIWPCCWRKRATYSLSQRLTIPASLTTSMRCRVEAVGIPIAETGREAMMGL
ncbi:MAG: hypothetical protein ACLTK0_07275 [Anaerovoracaceae bacterium]